ncbi:hypothetical protein DIPPA_30616 [Diplonema papillatum]|nr:hypothetical protein DIPPA_30616 [Diplonema papillatum]
MDHHGSVSPPRRFGSPDQFGSGAARGAVDADPTYEPIIGGHKSFSWEKELRERGLHASANEIAGQGDAFFEGPQGSPAPGSGSPRRNQVSPSPARRLPPGSVPRAGSMQSGMGYEGSPAMGSRAASFGGTVAAGHHQYSAAGGRVQCVPIQCVPIQQSIPAVQYQMPVQQQPMPIPMQHRMPMQQPMPMVMQQRVVHPVSMPMQQCVPIQQSMPLSAPMRSVPTPYGGQPPPQYPQQPVVMPVQCVPIHQYRGQSLPAQYAHSPPPSVPAYTGGGGATPNFASASQHHAYSSQTGGYAGSPTPRRQATSLGPMPRTIEGFSTMRAASQSPGANVVHVGGDDGAYEPIIGGHKSHSWETELRERGLHASANAVAEEGNRFFEGPQGHPAPGSGSPRRNRVSPSPARDRPPGYQ